MSIESEKPDHRLGFAKDYLTAVISLATAVLGITATFAEKLTDGGAVALLIAWIALGISIVACLVAFGRIDRELTGKGTHASVALFANLAYFTFCFGLAMVVIAAYRVAQQNRASPDFATLVTTAEVHAATAAGHRKLSLKTVSHDASNKAYVFIWDDETSESDVTVSIATSGTFLRLERR